MKEAAVRNPIPPYAPIETYQQAYAWLRGFEMRLREQQELEENLIEIANLAREDVRNPRPITHKHTKQGITGRLTRMYTSPLKSKK